MDQLIKPLYNKRDQFEKHEDAYVSSYSEDPFWKNIENNKYMTTKDLRESIEDYLKENKESHLELDSIHTNLKILCEKEKNQLPGDFLPTILSSRSFSINWKVLPLLKKLLEDLNEESETRLEIKNYIDFIENNSLVSMRLDLRDKVIKRYEKLEKKMDDIRESLDKVM